MARARKAKPERKRARKKKQSDVPAKEVRTTEPTAAHQLKPFQFRPGQSGNPAGRPKGSRNKLAESFLQDMYEAWQASGTDVISRVIKDEPATFLRSVVQIMPKELDVNVNKYDAMTDDQLRQQFLAALRDARALGVDLGSGDAASVH